MSEENRPYPEGIAGMSDEHGMPVPGEVLTKADFEYCQHAFNWIIPCREIVRRLATSKSVQEMLAIASDAEKHWAKMQKEATSDA